MKKRLLDAQAAQDPGAVEIVQQMEETHESKLEDPDCFRLLNPDPG